MLMDEIILHEDSSVKDRERLKQGGVIQDCCKDAISNTCKYLNSGLVIGRCFLIRTRRKSGLTIHGVRVLSFVLKCCFPGPRLPYTKGLKLSLQSRIDGHSRLLRHIIFRRRFSFQNDNADFENILFYVCPRWAGDASLCSFSGFKGQEQSWAATSPAC